MKKNLITTSILFSLSTLAFAQVELETVNVYSAYATPVNQDKTASAVTVLTEKDFAERNATYVSDVLKTVPGVAIGANGGRGAVTSLFLRGAESNHVAVVIDGVKMNPVSDAFDFGGLSLSNIERIEILRGEQSALWGSDAIGGVIYITTKSGLYKDKPFNVDFDFGTGSHGTYDASATVSGHHNNFYYALHGDSHRTRGISVMSKDKFNYTAQDGTSITTGGAVERDKFHRDNTSLRLGFDDSHKGVEVFASHRSQTTQNDTSLYSEATDKDYFRERETTFKLSGYVGNDQDLLKHKANVSHIKNDYNYFSAYPYSKDWKKLATQYQLDINFDRDGAVTQGVSLLGEYQKSHYESASVYSTFKEQKLTEKSLAAEYRLFTETDHSLSLSGRVTDSSKFNSSITGRLAGAYRLSDNLKAHASVGTAVHNPTFTEYYGYSATYLGNPDLKPEKSRGGEIGLLLETTNKWHSLDTTYFSRIVDNFITSEAVSPNVSRAINADGKTKVKGVEVVYKGKLTETLTAYANYTYTQSKNGNHKKGVVGTELDRRPKHTANAGIVYQVTDKLGASANIAYVGKRLDTYWGSYPSKRVKLPSYTLVNLGVNYQVMPHIQVYANVNNLFNKKYENAVEYGQDGRNLYVGLKGSF
ncbi:MULTISPECIES: TonB-dependent siderophore receptor [Glaesserella]|uniref:TonB-dependent receptor n=1 Tax=Glaesserella australis TaxID=2094024 RepID=A0A328C2T6_9PAST|nr:MULTISPECIES: TonB-dependent receptor [Glaesserella]AUI65407.1 TonB-dependent receptor [Glaesserella sp. 15-184]RAL19602.1 TonB-dependent receptor [Glaesserella australis]